MHKIPQLNLFLFACVWVQKQQHHHHQQQQQHKKKSPMNNQGKPFRIGQPLSAIVIALDASRRTISFTLDPLTPSYTSNTTTTTQIITIDSKVPFDVLRPGMLTQCTVTGVNGRGELGVLVAGAFKGSVDAFHVGGVGGEVNVGDKVCVFGCVFFLCVFCVFFLCVFFFIINFLLQKPNKLNDK